MALVPGWATCQAAEVAISSWCSSAKTWVAHLFTDSPPTKCAGGAISSTSRCREDPEADHGPKELMRLSDVPPELRSHISSYLDVPGLCAERATARENYSRKAFVAQLVQLARPDTPDVLLTAGDIYVENEDQIPQLEQALARDSFQVFAGLQGTKCIFNEYALAFKVWWASNPGAITHWCSSWIEHSSLSPAAQCLLIRLAAGVFEDLDWGALHLKRMFAAEVRRLETEGRTRCLRGYASNLACKHPEIREL
ncbi:unnamed protein product [Cladocopium goreaui]|uniref:Uncharacterized protein n=1 Tax=Cladocopium goreaui TaxID=2562237 RepID=A0A9P1CCJ9_9DINO|nr:unnamed protein product [Cladocopium goreaui]